MPSPDFEGFRGAMSRLREHFGHNLTFYVPDDSPVEYPAGTPLDPESGVPFDPTVQPVSGGGDPSEIGVNVDVVSKPLAGGEDGNMVRDAVGWLESGGIVLIVDIEDFHEIRNATDVDYAEERYKITRKQLDMLGPVHRYLYFCEQS